MSLFAKVPPLTQGDGSTIEKEEEKVDKLLKTFYSPLPLIIKEDPKRMQFPPIKDPEISMEEVRSKVFIVK